MPPCRPVIESEALDDNEADAWPLLHIFVTAADASAPETNGVRSVFDLAGVDAGRHQHQLSRFDDHAGLRAQAQGSVNAPQARAATVVRTDGVTRCTGAAYPSRWTPADHERERARRAQQRPPKPTKRARTKSAKLRGMMTDDFYEE